jgi:dTDP-4-amino-4,6-dideoxygalactose transaminase
MDELMKEFIDAANTYLKNDLWLEVIAETKMTMMVSDHGYAEYVIGPLSNEGMEGTIVLIVEDAGETQRRYTVVELGTNLRLTSINRYMNRTTVERFEKKEA